MRLDSVVVDINDGPFDVGEDLPEGRGQNRVG